MAIPSTGSVSMSQINTEFGRGLNLNAYRGTTYYTSSGGPFTFPSGSISMNDFRGTQASGSVTVNINALSGATYIAAYQGLFPVTATISFFNDGTYQINHEPQDPIDANWATPTTAGIGSSYWISWTRVGVIGTNGSSTPSSGRVQLNIPQYISVNKNPSGTTTYTAEYDIEIWNAASGGTRVGYAPGFTLVSSRI